MSKATEKIGFKESTHCKRCIEGRVIFCGAGHYSEEQEKYSAIDIKQHIKNQIVHDIDTMIYSDVRHSLNRIEDAVRGMLKFIDPLVYKSGRAQLDKALDWLRTAQLATRTDNQRIIK